MMTRKLKRVALMGCHDDQRDGAAHVVILQPENGESCVGCQIAQQLRLDSIDDAEGLRCRETKLLSLAPWKPMMLSAKNSNSSPDILINVI